MKDLNIFLFIALLGASVAAPENWEDVFMKIPNEAYAYEYLSYYTSLPHVAGTEGDYQTALYTHAKFQEFGLESQIWPFQSLVSWPISRQLQLIKPTFYNASLEEDTVSVDPSTYDPRITPTFNGYSPSGDVTAEIVYVNYGSWDDFEQLKAMGIPLAGKIALARYGAIFRGTKVMIAQLYNMSGMLIYSDPADDGYSQGNVFPEGPWRPASGVQRGSVMFLSMCPGDPRRRICSDDINFNWTSLVPSIPVQPISWQDALPILQNLAGNKVPTGWQGGLNFTYYIGPGPSVVHLKLEMEFSVKTLWNVIANIEGEQKDRAVIMGNHRDAWVFGAADPNSGTATMLVAYLNVDTAVTGPYFSGGATPSLASAIRKAATMVTNPNTGLPVSNGWNQQLAVLGSGSDFTAMLDHFGVASTDFGFGGPYGVYHSLYDDIFWMNNFGDPGYHYHKACAQMWGVTALQFIDAEVLPYNYTEYGAQLGTFYTSIVTLMKQNNGNIDLSSLLSAINYFQQAAAQVTEEIINIKSFNLEYQQDINDKLMLTERKFLTTAGLPGRPYFKHVVQAPGLYQGYDADVFPGLAQAIRDHDWLLAKQQAELIAETIENAGKFLAGNK